MNNHIAWGIYHILYFDRTCAKSTPIHLTPYPAVANQFKGHLAALHSCSTVLKVKDRLTDQFRPDNFRLCHTCKERMRMTMCDRHPSELKALISFDEKAFYFFITIKITFCRIRKCTIQRCNSILLCVILNVSTVDISCTIPASAAIYLTLTTQIWFALTLLIIWVLKVAARLIKDPL